MSTETEDKNENKEEKNEAPKQELPPLVISAQYVKDLSFEAPGLPQILFEQKEAPSLDINIDIKVEPLKENNFEVSLILKVQAKNKDKVIFLCELDYSCLAAINVPKEHMEPMVLVEIPRIIFPFARQIIADITKESGFAPVVLAPIDFFALYHQRMKAMAEQEAKKAQIN